MFALQEVAPDLYWVALPSPPGLSQPWGVPRNVFVFTGAAPALIDTGYAGTAPNLVAALDALDLDPADIQRVALTSRSADAAGALDLFPEAGVWTAAAADPAALDEERRRYAEAFEALLLHPEKPKTWTEEAAASFLAARFDDVTPRAQQIADGQPLKLGDYILDALQTGGAGPPSAAYFSADRGWLFPGPVAALTPRPIQSNPGDLLDAIERLGGMSVKRVFPVQGIVEEHPQIFFRALGLFSTNLRTNMQYVFTSGAQSSIDLAQADFGYLPDDLPRFAALVMEYDSVFREFAEAGVILDDGEGFGPNFRRYQMGTPLTSRGPSQPR